jgi:uncharacterized membrane protein YheB (UPF0754 family)
MNTYEKEDQALDTLIALTLKSCDRSEEQIRKDAEDYLTKEIRLPSNYSKAIKNIKNRIFAVSESTLPSNPLSELEMEYEESFMAMHRDNSSEKLDEETEEEIKKRRQKFIDDERKKNSDDNED